MCNCIDKERGREYWIDFAKFIGILAIVYGHTIQDGITNKYVYSFHVPLFFLLQGVIFSVTHASNKNFLQYLKRKAYTLLLPYYCFAIISTIAIYIASLFISIPEADIFSSFKDVVINTLIGDCESNSPLWFLPCSFVLSIIGYSIIALANKNKKYKVIILIVAAAIGCILLYVTEEFTNIRFLPWKIDGAIHMLPVFLAGYALNEFGILIKLAKLPIWLRAIISIILLSIGALLGIVNDNAGYLGNYYGNIWIMYLSALLTSIGICLMVQLFPKMKVISYVGQHTLSILLMHKFPILVFQKAIPYTKSLLSKQSVWLGIIVTVISISLCCLVELIIDRICPFIIGKYPKKRKSKCFQGNN